MRAIADEAGVSLGNAYYYFGSKEHLIQALLRPAAGASTPWPPRGCWPRRRPSRRGCAGCCTAWLDVAAPYHEFAGKFFKNAAEPSSPLSPFSPESAPAREAVDRALPPGRRRLGPQGRHGAARASCPSCSGCCRWASCSSGCTTPAPTSGAAGRWSTGSSPMVDRLVRMTRLPVVRGRRRRPARAAADAPVGVTRRLPVRNPRRAPASGPVRPRSPRGTRHGRCAPRARAPRRRWCRPAR